MESEGPALRVGYNKLFGALLLGAGALCFVLGLIVRTPSSALIGAMNVVIGVLYLTRPYFVLTRHAIELRNLLGTTMRRYAFDELAHLAVSDDGKSVFQNDAGGAPTRLKLTRWLADRRDWQTFLGLVQARAFE